VRLIVATRNRAKVAEVARLVDGLATVEALPATDTLSAGGDAAVAPETGESVAAVAIEKAVFWSRRIDRGELVVATDGGLEIPALGEHWNPVRTRRFAGEGATDLARAEALLALAADLTGEQRRIVWTESLAVARDGELHAAWSATGQPGMLARDVDPAAVAAGNGFWIPALWICPDRGGRRLADLAPEEAAARADHWRSLGTDLRAFLRTLAAASP
jgi:inosine/xanthosine triphosphate pyrophosphatase family protein